MKSLHFPLDFGFRVIAINFMLQYTHRWYLANILERIRALIRSITIILKPASLFVPWDQITEIYQHLR